ncbi:MAG: ferrochelatase, partial [Nitrospira sp.]|nr:ferrochelatase [Nitrospira sp.]
MIDRTASTAVLLINLGGPDSLDAVEPFLYNLFSDPDIMGYNRFIIKPLARYISKKRSPQVKEFYKLIGGRSPILELTNQQGEALKKLLSMSKTGGYEVFVAMRYWSPMIEDVIKELLTLQLKKIIVLPLYPHYSVTTTGSTLNEFNRIWRRIGTSAIEVKVVKEWYDNPLYINAMSEMIKNALEVNGLDLENCHIVFSAHGLPVRFIEKGDPYARHIERTVELISGRLGSRGNYHLCYQSRVGPLKWLGPYTEEMLKELGRKGVKNVLLVPISFVSDHLETLYEMD